MFYPATLLAHGAVDVIVRLGWSQQFGVAGVEANFGFIIFQAAGAYVAAASRRHLDTANGGYQIYIGGLHLPFPTSSTGAALAVRCWRCPSPSWSAAGCAATSLRSACW